MLIGLLYIPQYLLVTTAYKLKLFLKRQALLYCVTSFYGGGKLETEFTPNLLFPSNAASPLVSIVLLNHFLDFLFVFAERFNLVFHSWQTK